VIHVLEHGALIASGPADAVVRDERVVNAYLGGR
jgi:ABC-type branched-subunit amino acid transport system ATPase component